MKDDIFNHATARPRPHLRRRKEREMAIIDIVGWTGASIILIAYFGVSTKRLPASGWQYQAANVAGAVLLVINSTFYGVWPSVALNGIWVVIGIAALLKSSTISPAEREAKARAEGESK